MNSPAAARGDDAEAVRLREDLRGELTGEILTDPVSTQLYATDASIYRVRPLAIVRPRSLADVVATVQYAVQNDLTLHPRGAGSGVSGESLGRGIVLDMSTHLRRITPTPGSAAVTEGGPETVQVAAGVPLASLNRYLADHGRRYGPDPVTRSVTTMGGVINSNASGSHYLRSGSARDTVVSARIVTAGGEVVTLEPTPVLPPRSEPEPGDVEPVTRLARGLDAIARRFETQCRNVHWPPASGGYRIDDLHADDGRIDLARFIAGTQGTLGILIDATVRTESLPPHRGVVLAYFHRIDSAIRSAVDVLADGPVACDVMDRRLLQIARQTDRRLESIIPAAAEAAMILEIQGGSIAELRERLEMLRRRLRSEPDAAFDTLSTDDEDRRDLWWELFRRVIPRQARVHGDKLPLPFTEDIHCSPPQIPAMLAAVRTVLQRHSVTATVFCHVGHGQLHVRPMLDLADRSDRRKIAPLMTAVAETVWQRGGLLGVEHPAGVGRSALMARQYGELWPAMVQVKRLFDPAGRLQPGKFADGDPSLLSGGGFEKTLRPNHHRIDIVSAGRAILPPVTIENSTTDLQIFSPEPDDPAARWLDIPAPPPPQLPVLQHWPGGATITSAVNACNGCGRCRGRSNEERQCPMFRITSAEEASPRAKANLLRGVIAGELDVASLAGEQAKAVADLCFNCHSCRLECPASVNVPKIVGEIKAQYVATNGLPISDLLLGRIDTVAAIGARVAPLSNWVLRNGAVRWLLERSFGLTAARRIPTLARESFIRYAIRRRWHRPNPAGGLKVAYFVDHFANHHDPAIGRAFAEVLQHNRIGIYVPTGQRASGMARITAGDLRGARRLARRNVRILADAVRSGYTVVATEPSAALCLKYEYPNLLDTEDAHLVAEHSWEACQYLMDLHRGDRLALDLEPLPSKIAYHQPCHSRVLQADVDHHAGPTGTTASASQLLSLIPAADVHAINAGCSGMAGTWGLQTKNYRASLRIGWPAISAIRAAAAPITASECSACRLQLSHGSDREMIHPVKLIAAAYGRMTLA